MKFRRLFTKTIPLAIFLFVNLNVNGQSGYLTAEREGRKTFYKRGKPVRIVTTGNGVQKVIRGHITGFTDTTMIIEPFLKKLQPVPVSPSKIEKIRPLLRKGRKTAAWSLAGAGAYTGIMFLIIEQTTPMSYILFLPAMGAGLLFVYYYPITFLVDLINEKKASKGWKFSITKN